MLFTEGLSVSRAAVAQTVSPADSRHPAYLPYVYSVIALGAVSILYGVWQLSQRNGDYQWLVLAALTVITSTCTIKIPAINSRISLGDALYFTNVVLFGPGAGIITASLDGFVGSLRARTDSRRVRYTCLNVAAMATSALVGGTLFFYMVGREPLYFKPLHSFQGIVLPLAAFALIHYFLNSGSIAIGVALESRKNIRDIWRESFLWTSITYFAGAGAAGLTALTMGSFTPHAFAVAIPVLLAVHYTYKTYLSRVQEVRSLAYYDSLTLLPNRVLFKERLERALAGSRQPGKHVAVMFLDLDNFKRINDTYGHWVGDLLVRSVGGRLAASVRTGGRNLPRGARAPEVVIGRFGGDEFTILLPEISRLRDAALVADRLLQSFTSPFSLEGHEVSIGASIGISVHPYDGTDADTLLRNADTAMFHAKADSQCCYRFYSRSMDEISPQRVSLENELRKALGGGQFRVYYQPRVDAGTGILSGAEALVRWEHPEKGLLSAGDFISLTEEIGLIRPVGEWILRTVCAQVSEWRRSGLSPVPVAVNLCTAQFRQKNLAQAVSRALRDAGLEADLLELEVREGTIMQAEEETDRSLREMRRLGVRVLVDNFGTGYSSLARLKELALDALKIDRSFVAELSENPDEGSIAVAIVAMAKSMKLRAVAEGVETEGQVEFLRKHGCDELQGWLVGKPMPADEFAELLESGRFRRPLLALRRFLSSRAEAEARNLGLINGFAAGARGGTGSGTITGIRRDQPPSTANH